MDDKLTISTFQLFQMFPDQESARVYLEARRWPNGPVCPVCQKGDRITTRDGGFYRCNACKEDFTVRTGTIFERSHVPLHKWMRALAIVAVEGTMPTSTRLARDAKLRQPTAWAMLKRLKPALDSRGAPDALDRIADKVLSYRAPARTAKAKKRQRARRKIQRESSI